MTHTNSPGTGQTTANLTHEEARTRAARLDVQAYRVELDLSSAADPAALTFPSTTTIEFTADCAETFLDFLATSVHSVVLNGEPLDTATCFDGHRVALAGLRQQNVVTVAGEAAYSRTGQGLHRFLDPVDGNTYLYTHFEPADARRVFADFEQPDLKAPFTFVVTAPSGWEVRSNSPAASTATEGAVTTTVFAPTLPLPTYLTAVVAGPYHRAEDEWRAPGGALTVPLVALCRQSLAEHLDSDRIFTVTKQGMDFYHREFGYPYPWMTYDQAFVPEYNIGAMENPGCVTFTEHYLFRSAATAAQYEGRANTILHEMAHMWFGDLVTMRWWNDLWLKESFADYMGTHVNAAATEHTDAWTSFASKRKAWAYLQDQLPTTHPIVATIDDLEAARQNFDGITYAKGASVLKQLVAYVGQDAFFAGSRSYFQQHAFGNTTLADLLAELSGASGRDLAAWSRVWLETAGVCTLTPRLSLAPDGTIDRLVVERSAADPTTGDPVSRPHRLAVGLYALQDTRLVRTERIELDLHEDVTAVAEAAGKPAPDLVLVNDDDLTYAVVRLDERSLATVERHLGSLEEPLSRAVVWSALWNACRDGVLRAQDYLRIVGAQAPRESHVALLRDTLANARTCIRRYLPAAQRHRALNDLIRMAWTEVLREPGSGRQLTWARALASLTAVLPEGGSRLRGVLDGTDTVKGLALDTDLRWAMWRALAAAGEATEADLDTELQRDNTASGAIEHLAAVTSRPDAEVQAAAWRSLVDDDHLTNEQVDATIAGFSQPTHAELAQRYAEQYFDVIARLWATRPIEIASRLVVGLFPTWQDLQEGQDPDAHPMLRRAQQWLDDHPDAPAALRRLVIEQQDQVRRALHAQAVALS
ncbi:MAG TPA: aminopeptidase N [Segeticoccus sp.]|uniref:aminopeptidase N n=1 Tax=Segeticoccus sp. TaxID=2706531 RepID=UPI002D7E989C|nr:aminopeptidase N [Segeticoccus sp.]HET8601097.1 aminopeptidase N [Segeticoccus sp.]